VKRCVRTLVLAACAAALGSGCATAKRVAWETGLPGTQADFHVDSVKRRYEHLDVRLSSAGIQRRILARSDDAACEAMLREGQSVTWERSNPFGPLTQGDARCDVAGLGDLERWRDSRGRITTTTKPITTSETSVYVVHRDETYLYVLGGFSLAALLDWSPGTDQVLAMLPRGEKCAEFEGPEFASGERDRGHRATLEFRIDGKPALSLITRNGRCPVEAVMAAPRAGGGSAG
jgi:hypothetical protein